MIPPPSPFFRLVKLGEVSGQRPQFVKIAVRPISRYSFRLSMAARFRTRFQMYVPTPNSLIFRMSIAMRMELTTTSV